MHPTLHAQGGIDALIMEVMMLRKPTNSSITAIEASNIVATIM